MRGCTRNLHGSPTTREEHPNQKFLYQGLTVFLHQVVPISYGEGEDMRGGEPQKREALKDEDSVKENPKRTLPSEEDDTKREVLKRRDSDDGQSGIGRKVVDGAEDSNGGN
ncbi:hypothetical protein EYR41_008942 [Orbilia oligospora]|uniref:Uncharacterized protein n=1 Tax=Orbilia oligospora TaxID=2813651 RepID=A0A8H2HN06_ORBOL|nr:hypothetical protein EYR41_008942 [Orbilia oligospora]